MGKHSSSSTSHLLAARATLLSTLAHSSHLSAALSASSPRLSNLRHCLPHLSTSLRPALGDPHTLLTLPSHIHRAISPAAAVLRVFDAIHGLEPSLLSTSPSSDLPAFLRLLRRLDEALKFLSDNSPVAVQWLDDIVDYVQENSVADQRYISSLRNLLNSVKQSELETGCPLHGGLLDAALDRLESEFERLLSEHSVPLLAAGADESSSSSQAIASSLLPVEVVQKLILILERMNADDRIDRCVKVYVEIRGANVRASLKELGLEYLAIRKEEFMDVQSIEKYIVMWGKHLEFAVKHLFEAEYMLCSNVFERFGPPELWMGCFADIAAQAGMLGFLKFGRTVTESKKDPIKLLKLLDIFALLNNLRLDFNRLFGGQVCAEIQSVTRDLIKRVIDGACEIFWELLVQVELQRQTPPPSGGGVPKLVSFITDYCNRLLSEDYRPVLTLVLVIHRSWKREKFQDRLLTDSIVNIIQALEQNLEAWSKGYEDAALSCVFMMNTHWHFCRHLRCTKLGELMGDSWLRAHEQCKDYYAAIYMKESWGKLPALLSREGLILFSGGRATARDLVKKRLKAFNEEFDEMYRRQSRWVVSDKELREKTCQLAIQAIVPIYRSYMQNYGPLIEQEASSGKYAKYTVQSLENMLGSLFQNKPGRSASFTVKTLIQKG